MSHSRGTAIGAFDTTTLERCAARDEALGHAIDLVLHRAGVGVDVEV